MSDLRLSQFMTAVEVAEAAGIQTSSLYRYVQRKSVPEPFRVGRTLLWPRQVIESWLLERQGR